MSKSSFNIKEVITAINARDAEKYIGKEGYFSNIISPNLKSYLKATLIKVDTSGTVDKVFIVKIDGRLTYQYGAFIPLEKVLVIKDYRPYTKKEFLTRYKLMDYLHIRSVYADDRGLTDDITFILTGYSEEESEFKLSIEGLWLTLDEIFNKYRLVDEDGKTHPFGIGE